MRSLADRYYWITIPVHAPAHPLMPTPPISTRTVVRPDDGRVRNEIQRQCAGVRRRQARSRR